MTSDVEKKFNIIGQIIADIQYEVKKLRQEQREIKEFLLNPDKLGFEKKWKEYFSN